MSPDLTGLIQHNDRGSQGGIDALIGATADSDDNALATGLPDHPYRGSIKLTTKRHAVWRHDDVENMEASIQHLHFGSGTVYMNAPGVGQDSLAAALGRWQHTSATN